jgi:Zn-dependent protease
MFNRKELMVILLAGIIIGYLYAFSKFTWSSWILLSLLGFMVVLIHSFGQKFAANMLDASTETKFWTMDRFWFAEVRKFPAPLPAGLILPLIGIFMTVGWLKFLAITTFEATALPRLRSFSKVTEMQLAMIALSGAIANVLVAFCAFMLGHIDFAMMNLFFALFSMLPISSLDGTKIFFGSRLLWVFSSVFLLSLIILFEVAGLWATLLSALIIAIAIMVAYYISFENF